MNSRGVLNTPYSIHPVHTEQGTDMGTINGNP